MSKYVELKKINTGKKKENVSSSQIHENQIGEKFNEQENSIKVSNPGNENSTKQTNFIEARKI